MTARFNLNLLRRINRELGGHFDLDGFRHRARYDEVVGRVEIHLVSVCDQRVPIDDLDLVVPFAAGETIHTENLYYFSPDEIDTLAAGAGMRVDRRWLDGQRRFSLNLLAPLPCARPRTLRLSPRRARAVSHRRLQADDEAPPLEAPGADRDELVVADPHVGLQRALDTDGHQDAALAQVERPDAELPPVREPYARELVHRQRQALALEDAQALVPELVVKLLVQPTRPRVDRAGLLRDLDHHHVDADDALRLGRRRRRHEEQHRQCQGRHRATPRHRSLLSTRPRPGRRAPR